jgi:hypothetical protein
MGIDYPVLYAEGGKVHRQSAGYVPIPTRVQKKREPGNSGSLKVYFGG